MLNMKPVAATQWDYCVSFGQGQANRVPVSCVYAKLTAACLRRRVRHESGSASSFSNMSEAEKMPRSLFSADFLRFILSSFMSSDLKSETVVGVQFRAL